MTEKKQVKITPAKGRPMLTWVGKRPLSQVTAFPAQHIETFDLPGHAARRAAERDLWADWPDHYPRGGLLFHGDNKEVLAHLLANGFRGKVKLIYIDPPFDSGADYVRRVRLRGVSGSTQIEGEAYTLGEQIQYTDIWTNDNYLQFMFERLLLLKELLAEDGSLWLHSDHRKTHLLRMLMDEIFGPDNFLNTVSWRSQVARGAKVAAFYFPYSTHYIHVYAKNREAPTVWNAEKREVTYTEEDMEKVPGYMRDQKGFFRTSDPGSYTFESLVVLHREGRLYAPHAGQVVIDEPNKRVYASHGGNIGVKYYARQLADGTYVIDRAIDNLWEDIPGLGTIPGEDLGYPTQKTEPLLARIIRVSSNPGDLVLDSFIGSGTTATVAQRLGRRWIGCDINKGAIQTTAKRLQTVIQEQIAQGNNRQGKLMDSEDASPERAQLSFTVWRVNDYDLQIQHNEAVNLACEHIGIQRTRTDPFFDGVMGRNLVKIVPFNHPVSPLDLEEIRRELEARPEEDRNITVVCLGKELAADAWIEDWNRLRTGKGAVNRIEVIELRTDPRYGKFFEHKPASVKVKITRKGKQIQVDIQDFVSPTIIERLSQQSGLLKPQIEDWRAMVDCVMIDPAYNGEVFNVALSDVPPKKDDLVAGTYTLPAPDGPSTVAVKIIDMLGEEVLVTERVH